MYKPVLESPTLQNKKETSLDSSPSFYYILFLFEEERLVYSLHFFISHLLISSPAGHTVTSAPTILWNGLPKSPRTSVLPNAKEAFILIYWRLRQAPSSLKWSPCFHDTAFPGPPTSVLFLFHFSFSSISLWNVGAPWVSDQGSLIFLLYDLTHSFNTQHISSWVIDSVKN